MHHLISSSHSTQVAMAQRAGSSNIDASVRDTIHDEHEIPSILLDDGTISDIDSTTGARARGLSGPSFLDNQFEYREPEMPDIKFSVDIEPDRSTQIWARHYSASLLSTDLHDRAPAPVLTRHDSGGLSELTFISIESVFDRGNTLQMRWEQSQSKNQKYNLRSGHPTSKTSFPEAPVQEIQSPDENEFGLPTFSTPVSGVAVQFADGTEEMDWIKNKIYSSLVQSAFDSKDYLPLDQLREILSQSVVRKILVQHFGDSNASQYESTILGTLSRDGATPSPPKRLRIFAILVLINQVKRLTRFIQHAVDDRALPLHFTRMENRQARVSYILHSQDATHDEHDFQSRDPYRLGDPVLRKFDVWPLHVVTDFTLWQSIIHVPFLHFPGNEIYFYDLHQDSTLPFDEYDLQETGGYGSVRKAAIHSSHSNRCWNSKNQQPVCFAVKKLQVPTVDDYLQAIEHFDKLGIEDGNSLSNHLIPLQLTFRHGTDYYLMFPWADGNLKQFWSQRRANPEELEEVRWFMAQCSGITRGLSKIHHLSTEPSHEIVSTSNAKQMILGGKELGRHGDIKPENILWFQDYHGKRDHLVISDFGLTQFNSAHSRSQVQQDPIPGFSGTYRPPELHLEGQSVSQNYDVWSLGCVFLEFVSWFLLGYRQTVGVFARARLSDEPQGRVREDIFFAFENDHHGKSRKAKLKDSVVKWIERLHKMPHCYEPLHALLDLIQFTMLIPNPKDRWKCSWVNSSLRQLESQCENITFIVKAASKGPDPSRYVLNDSGKSYRNHPSRLDDDYASLPLDGQASISELLLGLTSGEIESVGDGENDGTPAMKPAASPESNDIQHEQPAGLVNFDSAEHATNTRFSEGFGGVVYVGHSEVGSGTDLTNANPCTESGCTSLGKDTAPTSVENSASKQQRREFGSFQLSDHDDYDAATVYSAADSVLENYLEAYKSELSKAILEAVHPRVSDAEQLESLAPHLPGLLQAFALRLGSPGSGREEWKIMRFVHEHRNDITTRFDEDIKNIVNKKDRTPLAAKKNEDLVRLDVNQWRQGVPQGEATEQDISHTPDSSSEETPFLYPEGEDRRMREEIDVDVDVAEEPSLPDKQGYSDAVINSVAYSWLTAALVKTLTMAPVEGEDMCANFREKIHASLGRTRTVSSRSPSKRHAMVFTAEWDPKLFLGEQFPNESDMRRLFRQVLTLTGSTTDAQVLPCAEYLLQTWPTTGLSILEVVEDALVTGREASRELKDKSLVSCRFDHSKLHVKIEGTADSITTVAEQIIWLGASLRPSCSESGLATCRPQIRISGSTAGAPPNCHIDFSVEERNTTSQEAGDGQCWHEIFQNPVVVGGYPIPRRAQYGSGLEMPLNVMAGLTSCQRINQYMGHHFLKGFSTALVPTGKTKDAVLWHLYYSEDGSRLPYSDMEPIDKVNISLGELTQARHIVGWCTKAQFFAGAAGMNYNIEPSWLKQPGREFSLEKVSFSLGQILTGGVQFAIGRKDEPVRITRQGYDRKLAWLKRKYVTLWDVSEKRGWLVNGNSALLHLLRASLEYYKSDEFNDGCLFREELFKESLNPFTLGSVRDVLSNSANQKLRLFLKDERSSTETKVFSNGKTETVTKTVTSWTTVKDRVEELYETLEKLIDHNATSEASYKGLNAKPRFHDLLQGWDFSDIARDRDPFHLKNAKLPLDLMNWVEFTRAIPAITLFGRGFGDMIRASPPDPSGCQVWRTVPKNKHLLCISVADLRAIIELGDGNQRTNPIEVAPEIIWKNPFNGSPFHTDCLCVTGCEAMKEKDHHCIQELMSTKAHAISNMAHSASNKLGLSPSPKAVVDIHLNEHYNGAVIFGRRAEWKFSRDTSATTESPTPESSQVRTPGHSSTSAGSNVIDSLSLSPLATLQPSESEGHNSAATLSAVPIGIRGVGSAFTVGEQELGSRTPDSHQAAGLDLNDPPSQVVENLNPENSEPKRLSLRRRVTELVAKKWRGLKSQET